MGYRYRLSVDVCEEGGGVISGALLQEVLEAMTAAAKLTIEPDMKRIIKVAPVKHGRYPYHHHTGEMGCSGCTNLANDDKGSDVSDVFTTTPV